METHRKTLLHLLKERAYKKGKFNTPETDKYGGDPRVQFEFGIGGDDKMNSSSWILKGYFERQRKLLGI